MICTVKPDRYFSRNGYIFLVEVFLPLFDKFVYERKRVLLASTLSAIKDLKLVLARYIFTKTIICISFTVKTGERIKNREIMCVREREKKSVFE